MEYLLLHMESLPPLERAQIDAPSQLDDHVILLRGFDRIYPTDHVQDFDMHVECQAFVEIPVECADVVVCWWGFEVSFARF